MPKSLKDLIKGEVRRQTKKEYLHEYYRKHQEEIKEKSRIYYKERKDLFYWCECGRRVLLHTIEGHENTDIHKKLMNFRFQRAGLKKLKYKRDSYESD